MDITQRFINYVEYDTQSDENSTTTPSTLKQLELSKLLVSELHELGVKNAYLDEHGIVYGHIAGNTSLPKIGLIAHIDTALEVIGGNFTPRVIKNYEGGTIKLNEELTLSSDKFPSLLNHLHHDLVVTDGNHLLGGDDKAGIAIIMDLVQYYANNPQIKHAPLRICFTPDEEIGSGADNFSLEKMDADIAYTLDGGAYDEINFENFNAASIDVLIKGVAVHPGSAKGIMVNSQLVAMEFNSLLNPTMIPSLTENYEGFNHLVEMKGIPDQTTLSYIVRNHDLSLLNSQIEEFKSITKKLSDKYKTASIELTIKDSYKNMYEYFKTDMTAVEKAKEAILKCGFTPKSVPIRGGTDGARITFMGLPCPNLGTGDYNCHGRYEYVSVNEMKNMVEILKVLTSC